MLPAHLAVADPSALRPTAGETLFHRKTLFTEADRARKSAVMWLGTTPPDASLQDEEYGNKSATNAIAKVRSLYDALSDLPSHTFVVDRFAHRLYNRETEGSRAAYRAASLADHVAQARSFAAEAYEHSAWVVIYAGGESGARRPVATFVVRPPALLSFVASFG